MIRAVPALDTRRIALVGVPNCGKTATFNRLTGSRQKVANYPGVTVERKEGALVSPGGQRLYRIIDLPGAYSLIPNSLDEAITRDVVTGRLQGEAAPELIVCVLDATNLRLSLRLALELKLVGVPLIVALNMSDLARQRGYKLNVAKLAETLGVPVVETVAVRPGGEAELIAAIEAFPFATGDAAGASFAAGGAAAPAAAATGVPAAAGAAAAPGLTADWQRVLNADVEATQRESRRILDLCGYIEPLRVRALQRLDAVVMHPILGPLCLAALLFFMFQAVFSWAVWPMDAITAGMAWLGTQLQHFIAPGLVQSLLVDGVLAGAGSVLAYLPQILILFTFILVLEDSGYLPRAAYLLDRLMGGLGLSGRAFIPLLSSFACAIPGIMATRTIPNVRERMATILLAPIMTCSARLPVYALIIGAFIPARSVGWFNLRGLVLFGMYVLGVLGAVLVALVLKRTTRSTTRNSLLMELPEYRWPNLRNLGMGLWERTQIFVTRVGTIILTLMVLLWFLATFPAPPAGATGPAIEYSVAGMIGRGLHTIFAPIGFNWQICVALVPGLAAREVAVGALGTVYALSASGADVESALRPMLAASWSLATALSFLAWYAFAPQCLSTLVTVRRETNSWRYPLGMAAYLFAMAYVASFITYRVAVALGGG
jgi:ferrous iron transport protein B